MKRDAARVTVVIPVWGAYADIVGEAAASARDQAVPTRVIVVDSGSNTRVPAVDGCELVRSDVRLSVGAARNLGLSRVASEYVVFLDADDLLLPDAIGRLVGALDRRPDALALVGGILDPTGAPYRLPRRGARVLARRPTWFAWLNAVWSLFPVQGCSIMRTAAVRQAGGYADASGGEDWALGASLAFRGPIAFDPTPAFVYRFRPDSLGVERNPLRSRLTNAGRIRRRLRSDPAVQAGPWALGALTATQMAAALVGHPLAQALRSIRGDAATARRVSAGRRGDRRRRGAKRGRFAAASENARARIEPSA